MRRSAWRGWLAAALAAVVAATAAVCGDEARDLADAPPTSPPARPEAPSDQPLRARGRPRVETVATGLEIPWEIAFLPDRSALVTERPGRVRMLGPDGRLRPEPVAEIPVAEVGEGGLLGVAVDPRFRSNRFVYLYRTTEEDVEIVRYRLAGGRLHDEQVILGGIAVGPVHDSGRLHFGPDERLYLTTGDAGESDLAQDPRSFNGKMLRMNPAQYRGRGGGPQVFALGLRNSQGFDWQPRTRRIVATEHGPVGNDEVNVLVQGGNYGWPVAQGRHQRGRFIAPIALYPDSIAPAGATFVTQPGSSWTGDFMFAALVGEQLRHLRLDGVRVVENRPLYEGRFGRLRTVREGPNGALYVLTSNRDGRGDPEPGDDRILRIIPPAG